MTRGQGLGKPGYCSICALPEVGKVNQRLKEGQNARQVGDFVAQLNGGRRPDRRTIYSHREHITSSQDKLVAYAERAPEVIKKTTTEEFLGAVRDIGMRKAITDPDSVSIDHALKAASILSQKKNQGVDALIVLAQIVTGNAPPANVVEGEFVDATDQ